MADRIELVCEACRITQTISWDDIRAVGGKAYIECPACHHFNYFEHDKESLNG